VTTRLTRVEQVERNRGLLLDAARETFLERGYAGATIDAIADQAGFSKGVVYSQFAGKSDLFLALLERRIEQRADDNDRVVAEHPGADALGALMRFNIRNATEGAGWARLLIEFRVVAARDPRLNGRYAELHARSLERFGRTVASALRRDGATTVLPPRTFAQLIFALDSGAVLEQSVDTTALPLDLFEYLIARLVTPS
jgi:AcrR family transcriptional regulator